MLPYNRSTDDQQGVALVMALIILLVLSGLAASLIFVTQTEIWSTANYRTLIQARYTAEAGAQRAANWMANSYTAPASLTGWNLTQSPVLYNGQPVVLSAMAGVPANYSDSTVQSAFNTALNNQSLSGMNVNANYSVTATLLRMQPITAAFSGTTVYLQTWQITSQGNIAGLRPAQVQVTETIEKTASPLFTYAAFSTAPQCGSLAFSSNTQTDSFDSSVAGGYAASQQNSGGNIGSNGNINFASNTTIYGSMATPYGNTSGSCSGTPTVAMSGATRSVTVTGGLQQIPTVTYPTPALPNPLPPTTNQNLLSSCGAGCTNLGRGAFRLAPGNWGNLSCSSNCDVHFTTGTYNINSLYFASNTNIVIDSGPVIINIAGQGALPSGYAMYMSSNAGFNTTGIQNIPSNLQIVYGGTAPIEFASNNDTYALLYFPNAPLTWRSNNGLYGAVIASTINNLSNTQYHYDRSLANNGQMPGKYHVAAFSWSKY